MSRCLRTRYAATAWQASCTATAWRSRSTYSTSSGGPSSLSCLALMTSCQPMTSRAAADRVDQGLVDQVLHGRAGGVRRDRRQPVDLGGGQLVVDLVEVALVGADAAALGGVADLVDAVDAAGAQQGVVQCLGQVAGHHDEDPVLRRRLGAHAQRAAQDPVEEAPGLLQAAHLGEQGLQGAHAPAAVAHATHDDPVAMGPDQQRPRTVVLVRQPVAGTELLPGKAVSTRGLAPPTLGAALGLAAAQGVGLVEEHDDPAVPQRHLARLPEQRLDLQDPDTHEHVRERAGLDEHERRARSHRRPPPP